VSGFVIDASVAIKWVVDEPGAEIAIQLLEHTLMAPDLLGPECANILGEGVASSRRRRPKRWRPL
jgi:predicted nucleic acid-binding protein